MFIGICKKVGAVFITLRCLSKSFFPSIYMWFASKSADTLLKKIYIAWSPSSWSEMEPQIHYFLRVFMIHSQL